MTKIETILNLILLTIFTLTAFVYYKVFTTNLNLSTMSLTDKIILLITTIILIGYLYAWFEVRSSKYYQIFDKLQSLY